MSTIILLIIGVVVFTEWKFSPRLDKTSDGELLLWYNEKNKRKYIKLW